MTNDQIISRAFPMGLTRDKEKIAVTMLNWCRLHKGVLGRNMPRHYNMIDAIRPAVAKVSGMFYDDIISKGRKAEKVKWRYLIVALLYEHDKTTQREISDSIGFDRSTVCYAISCVSERKEWNTDYNRLKDAVNKEMTKQAKK